MVVAGRVLEDGDVAIMMVEAESTPSTLRLLADSGSGAVRPVWMERRSASDIDGHGSDSCSRHAMTQGAQ